MNVAVMSGTTVLRTLVAVSMMIKGHIHVYAMKVTLKTMGHARKVSTTKLASLYIL